MKLAKK